MAPKTTTTTMIMTSILTTTKTMIIGGGTGQKRKRGMTVEEWEEAEVEEKKGEEAECVMFLSSSKLGMNEVTLFEYFNT